MINIAESRSKPAPLPACRSHSSRWYSRGPWSRINHTFTLDTGNDDPRPFRQSELRSNCRTPCRPSVVSHPDLSIETPLPVAPHCAPPGPVAQPRITVPVRRRREQTILQVASLGSGSTSMVQDHGVGVSSTWVQVRNRTLPRSSPEPSWPASTGKAADVVGASCGSTMSACGSTMSACGSTMSACGSTMSAGSRKAGSTMVWSLATASSW